MNWWKGVKRNQRKEQEKEKHWIKVLKIKEKVETNKENEKMNELEKKKVMEKEKKEMMKKEKSKKI